MNKQTQTGIAIGGGVLVVGVLAWFLFLRPAPEATPPVVTTQVTVKQTQTGDKTASATPPSKPGAFGTPNLASVGGVRKDPFLISWKDNTLPPPDVFSSVQPIRVTPAILEEPQEEIVEVREAPSRRYSGFMNGDGVFAVLESGGETEIVQPGSITKGDSYKVVSITADQVFLRKQEGNVIRTQVVLYGDAPPTLTGNRPAGGAGFGQQGTAGGQFGGGRRPGGSGGKGGAGSE